MKRAYFHLWYYWIMKSQSKRLTPKQTKIVKAKVDATLKDIPQRQFAPKLYPNAEPRSAEVLVSRELQKVDVQKALHEALEKHGLSPDSVINVVADGMKAKKPAYIDKNNNAHEGAVDHSIRLKAAGMAANFMGIGKQAGDINLNFNNYSQDQKTHYDL